MANIQAYTTGIKVGHIKAMNDTLSNLEKIDGNYVTDNGKYNVDDVQTYHLSVVGDYVDWNFWECAREILQNFIDAARESEGIYRVSRGKGHFYNSGVMLERDTLLIGVSSKRDDAGAIGHFGEGYKLAIARLCDLYGNDCCKVIIDRNHDRELWTFSLQPSPLAPNRKVLSVEIVEVNSDEDFGTGTHFIIPVKDNEAWESVSNNCLYLQQGEDGNNFRCRGGNLLLLEERNKGKMFVKGLYVSKSPYSWFGYNLQDAQLDRDRRRIADWDLYRSVGKAWARIGHVVGKTALGAHEPMYHVPENIIEIVASRFLNTDYRDVVVWNTSWSSQAATVAAAFIDACWSIKHPRSLLPVQLTEHRKKILAKLSLEFTENHIPGYSTYKIEHDKYDDFVDEIVRKKMAQESDIEQLTEINEYTLSVLQEKCVSELPEQIGMLYDYIKSASRTAQSLTENCKLFVIPDMETIIKIRHAIDPEGEAERTTAGIFSRGIDGNNFIIIAEKQIQEKENQPANVLNCLVHEIAHGFSMEHDFAHHDTMSAIFVEMLGTENVYAQAGLDW